MKHQNTNTNATVNAQNTNNGKENAMTRTAIMEKLDNMGVSYKKKASLQELKDILENELNARFYAKYGTPKENAMEKEAEKLMNNLIQSLTKNNTQKEENTMTTQNTENTTSAPVNAENTTKKEEEKKAMKDAKNAEKKAQKEAEKKAKAEKKAAEKAQKEAEKKAAAEKAEAEKKAAAERAEAEKAAVLQAVTTVATDNSLTMVEIPKKKALIVKMGAHRVFEVYEVRNGYKLFVADKYVNTGWWMDILGSIAGVITMNFNPTYYMKHWFCLNAENLLAVLSQM